MKFLFALVGALLLSGCTAHTFVMSPTKAVAVDDLSIRAPMPVKIQLHGADCGYCTGPLANLDNFSADIKTALLSSGVFYEDPNSSRKIDVIITYSRKQHGITYVGWLFSAFIFPGLTTYELEATAFLSDGDETLQRYEYQLRLDETLTVLNAAYVFGRWESSTRREFGAIIGSNLVSDLGRDGLL